MSKEKEDIMEFKEGVEFTPPGLQISAGPEAQAQPAAVPPAKKPYEMDLDERATYYARELRRWPDAKKIQPLKQLVNIGGLSQLKYILPLSQYPSDFIRKLARNTVIKIILRALKEDEESHTLDADQKKQFIDLLVILDNKYLYLKDIDLVGPKFTETIYDILIQENKEFTIQKLADVIVDDDERVQATAVRMIAEISSQSEISLLVKLLRDRDHRVRANVIEALEIIGDPNILGILMRFKMDRNNRVRANAIKALWNLGFREVEEPLREMLFDSSPVMRASAVWTIGQISHNQPHLKALLKIVEYDSEETVQDSLEKAWKNIAHGEKGLRILVIGNDRNLFQVLCRNLARDGFHVLAAFNGTDGVTKAIRQRPDIILLDLDLAPNSLEVIKQITSHEATMKIPLIVLSDFNSSTSVRQAREAGAADFLNKPLVYQEVREKVRLFLK
ncbi:MAG TPA: HEAT repeat domain-containing protein [archaeon]|nr:HEAT repeat domain-containing protein [archaeon]